MGATLPAMERVIGGAARRRPLDRRAVRRATRLGAVLGVLAAAFWLVPALGLRADRGDLRRAEPAVRASRRCACFRRAAPVARASRPIAPRLDAARAACAPRAHRFARHRLRGAGRARAEPGHRGHGLHVRAAAGGLPGRQRASAPPATSAGSSRRARSRERLGDRLLGALAAACLVGTATLWAAESIEGVRARSALGGSMAAALGRRGGARARWPSACRRS